MAQRHETQMDIIRNYLLLGKSITPIEPLDMCGCFRLSSVIHRLRHDENIHILMDKPQACDGKPYARYWVDKSYLQSQLEINFN